MNSEQATDRDAIEPTSDWPIIGRLIAFVALTVALLVGAFAGLDAFRSARDSAAGQQVAAEQLAAILASHLWNFDYAGVQNVIATVIKREGVLAASVTDAYGVKVHDSPALTAAATGTRTIRVPITAPVHAQLGNRSIGEMTLTVPLTPIGQYLGEVMARGLVAFFIVFIPCALVIAIYLRRYVSTPLRQLSLAIRQTLRTGRHVQTEFSGDSMLGQLSLQFDRMQEQLRLTSLAREQLIEENHAIASELRESLQMLQLESASRHEQAEILNSVLLSINQFVSCFDSRNRLLVSNVPRSPDCGYFDALQTPPGSADDMLEALATQGFSGRIVPTRASDTDRSGRHGNLVFALEAEGPNDSAWKVQVLAMRNGGTAIVGTDITEARRVAGELLQTKKMDALGELTSGVAHDFNNILSVISGNLELTSLQPTLDEASRKQVDAALFACQRAEKRVMALLSYARQEVATPERVNVRDMIDELTNILPSTLGAGIALVMSNEQDFFVDVDPQHLYSALLNLAINARDAMPGGGTIKLTTGIARDDEVRAEQLDPSRRYIAIAVADTGHGIAQATRERIFEPFSPARARVRGPGWACRSCSGSPARAAVRSA
ncbi:MAG: histidine kinase dimerization/phospho-acceptor domain-containing protein [Burkholderiaceae bacterium]